MLYAAYRILNRRVRDGRASVISAPARINEPADGSIYTARQALDHGLIDGLGYLDDAIAQANATRYGLASSIFTKDQAAIDRFLIESRAGCVNINTGTAGASGKLPFGGLGISGNHRPAGAFALDYCAYPFASMVERGDAAALSPGMRFEDKWV